MIATPATMTHWTAWPVEAWELVDASHLEHLVCDPAWLLHEDAACRNLLLASLHHGAPQAFIQPLFDHAAQDLNWSRATHHETVGGVGLLAHVFRRATKRQFDYRDWLRVALQAAPPRSATGKGLLWQLSRLAAPTDTPLAWFAPGELCIDPRWISLSINDWQAGVAPSLMREWIVGQVMQPLRHLSGTLSTSATSDMHALSRYLRPLHAHDRASAALGAWQEDLRDVMDVLDVVLEVLGRYTTDNPFNPAKDWQPVQAQMARLGAFADLDQGVFADLLARHPLNGAGWTGAVAATRALREQALLQSTTQPSEDARGGRRL